MENEKSRILVVDDDPNILKVIRMRLEGEGYRVSTAEKAEDAITRAREGTFHLALVDLKLPEKDGIGVMKELHEIDPELPVIILTAYGTIKSAVTAMSKGASTYLTKPFDNQELLLQIRNCLEKSRLSNELKALRRMVRERYGFENIIGKSKKMKEVLEQVSQAAGTDANVFIEGDSGTGKELIAKTLHLASPRKNRPFVAINCAAIPETLLESELFGYEKGAFTGATANKRGLFAHAHTGTFFLDEISEMPLTMQSKLLRVLQEREFYPLGGEKTVSVDIRLISSSNKNLKSEAEKGNFRQDLFYRLHVIHIKLPTLQERKEDIPILAMHFLKRFSKQGGKRIKGFSPSTLQKLMLHSWPGNVRELENTIESAVVMATKDIITEDFLLQARDLEQESLKPFKYAKEDFERDYLVQLIELTRGNVSQAAKLAGKYRADLYELFRKHGIDPADFRKDEGNTTLKEVHSPTP
jgi:two-component system response regulator GlrR